MSSEVALIIYKLFNNGQLISATKGQIKEKPITLRAVQHMPIKLFGIENFKSIKLLSINCRRVNLFIGEPNSGKSNFLEAIGVLSHLFHGSIQDFVRFETMTDLYYDHILEDPLEIRFDEISIKLNFKDGRFTCNIHEGNKTARLFTYRYDGGSAPSKHPYFKRFKFYRFAKQSDFPRQESEFLNPPDGDNLLHVILTRKGLRRIIKEIFDKFGYRIVFRPREGKIEVQKESEDILFSFPYSLSSDTIQRLIFYLAAIHSNKNSIVTFEEPEAHAFPYYTKYLAETIALDKNNNQYFIATHNPYFLTSILEKTPKKEVAIFATSLVKYQTKAKPLTAKQKEEILDLGSAVFFNIKNFLG